MEWIKYVAKALVAGVIAFGGAFATANVDNAIVTGEWVAIGVATVVALVGVFAVVNGPLPEGS